MKVCLLYGGISSNGMSCLTAQPASNSSKGTFVKDFTYYGGLTVTTHSHKCSKFIENPIQHIKTSQKERRKPSLLLILDDHIQKSVSCHSGTLWLPRRFSARTYFLLRAWLGKTRSSEMIIAPDINNHIRSLNYHLDRQGPDRRGGDGRRGAALLTPFVTRLWN